MGLYVHLDITAGRSGMRSLGVLEIIRKEPLDDRSNPDDEVHEYEAKVWNEGRVTKGPERFTHRYGDGAWTCVRRALEALDQ